MLFLHGFVLIWSSADPRPGPGPRGVRFVLADGCEPTLAYAVLVALAVAGAAALRGWPAWVPPLFSIYLVFFAGLAALIRSFMPRSPDAYFTALLVCIIVDLIGTAGYETVFGWGSKGPALLRVLMPLTWDEHNVTRMGGYFVVPLGIGVAALLLARVRSAK
jgi:hypothetical protein